VLVDPADNAFTGHTQRVVGTSGGLDSGTIVSLMGDAMSEPVRTHTVGFSDRATDEREDAAAVARALGADHVATEVRAAAAKKS